MEDVEAVPGARVVEVVLGLPGHEPVVHRVVDTPQRQGRSHLIALAGVVVDDIEDDLEPGPVQGAHHGLELAHLLSEPAGGIAHMGRQEGDGVVAPVVGQSLIDQMAVGHEVVHRHQLHRGHPEAEQMIDDRVRGQAEVGPAQVLGYARVLRRHAPYVCLVNHRLVPRCVGGPVVLPGEGRVDHETLRHGAGRIPRVERKVFLPVADPVAEELVAPANGTAHRLGVRIDEQLAVVEPVPAGGLVGAVHPVAVQRAGPHVGEVRVPDVVRPLGHGDGRRRLAGRGLVEETELHCGGVLGEEGEVDPLTVPGGSQRVRAPGPDSHCPPAPWAREPAERARAGGGLAGEAAAGILRIDDGGMFGTVSVEFGGRPPRRAEAVGTAVAVGATHTTRARKLGKGDAEAPDVIPARRRDNPAAEWSR
jgi:hypothetical protein